MTTIEQIRACACAAIQKSGSRCLQQICNAHHILLLASDMGFSDSACKGFFLQQDRIRSITINSALDEHTRRLVLAHELGHALLHQNYINNVFHDFGLFTDQSHLEYEANLFAAELLLGDETVLSVLQEGADFFHAASLLHVPPQILDFKVRILKKSGLLPMDAPIVSHGDFLKYYTASLPHDF